MAGLRRNFQPLKPSMGASFQAPPTAVAHPPAEPTVVINNTVEIGGSGIVGGVDLLVRKLTSADREGQRGSRSILLASALAVLLVATMAKHGPSPLALMGTVYAVERLATEWWKAIVREQDQSRYTIPMRLGFRGTTRRPSPSALYRRRRRGRHDDRRPCLGRRNATRQRTLQRSRFNGSCCCRRKEGAQRSLPAQSYGQAPRLSR
jgi:hypothetical protein